MKRACDSGVLIGIVLRDYRLWVHQSKGILRLLRGGVGPGPGLWRQDPPCQSVREVVVEAGMKVVAKAGLGIKVLLVQ